jgi:hypothetical protein
MKFAVNKTISYTNDDRVLIFERNEDYFNNGYTRLVKYLVCALIEVTRDWNDDDELPIVSDTDSIQIRPKAIFKSSKGYYYKNSSGRGKSAKTVYLTDSEVNEMKEFIKKFKEYLVI